MKKLPAWGSCFQAASQAKDCLSLRVDHPGSPTRPTKVVLQALESTLTTQNAKRVAL